MTTFLCSSHLFSNLSFNPSIPGMTIPIISGSPSRITPLNISAGNLAHLMPFAELNRSIKNEAKQLFDRGNAYLVEHNQAKTVLVDPGNRKTYAEFLFDFIGNNGFLDRSIDLASDLSASRFITQTYIYQKTEGPEDQQSLIYKSMSSKHDAAAQESDYLKDHSFGFTLRGKCLSTLLSGAPEIPADSLSQLALFFSGYILYFGGFQNPDILSNGLHALDEKGRAQSLVDKDSQDIKKSLTTNPQKLSHNPNHIKIVSQPPNPEAPVDYDNTPLLSIDFYMMGGKPKINLRVTSTPENPSIALTGGLLDIAQLILSDS